MKKEGHFRTKLISLGLIGILLATSLACGGQATKPVNPPATQTQSAEVIPTQTFAPDLLTKIAQVNTPAEDGLVGTHIFDEVQVKKGFRLYDGPKITIDFDAYGNVTDLIRSPQENACAANQEYLQVGIEDLRTTTCIHYLSIANQIGLFDQAAIDFMRTMASKTVLLSGEDVQMVCQLETPGGCQYNDIDIMFVGAESIESVSGHEITHDLIGQIPDGVYYFDDRGIASCLKKINGVISLYGQVNDQQTHETTFHPETLATLSDLFFNGQTYLFENDDSLNDMMAKLSERMKSKPDSNFINMIYENPTLAALSIGLEALTDPYSISSTFTPINVELNNAAKLLGLDTYEGTDVLHQLPLDKMCGQ